MTSPRVYQCLVDEIQSAAFEGSISSPITSAEARKMSYLQAVIKKALRIHPPITELLVKVINPDEEVIKAQFVPDDTVIEYCV